MNKKAIFGILGLGAVVALMAGGKKAKAASAPKVPGEPVTPEETAATEATQERQEPAAAQALATAQATPSQVNFAMAVVAALSTGNPETVRATAAKLEPLGYPYAAQLRAIADDMEKAAAARGATRATPAETLEATTRQKEVSKQELPPTEEAEPGGSAEPDAAPAPAASATQAPQPASGSDFEAGRAQSAALVTHLLTHRKGTEDRELVRRYQTAHGLKPDGLFGPVTASEVASFGIVPPVASIYWPADFMQAKRDLAATLIQSAQQFPAKAAEFTAQAKAIR